jgi:hypothetical protein
MRLSYLGLAVALEEPNFHGNGSASVKHKYLSRVISSEADAAKTKLHCCDGDRVFRSPMQVRISSIYLNRTWRVNM